MRRLVPLTLLALAASAPSATAAPSTVTIKGAGFGHGVGMSQYGALGAARAGWTHERILAHYYRGTQLGRAANDPVRVLIASGGGVSFSGAARIGARSASPGRTYTASSAGVGRVRVSGVGTFAAPLRVLPKGSAPMRYGGASWRGWLELRPAGGGVNAINAVGLEQYVAGVVARESPPSWPAAALEAQAVAARTYAIATSKGGVGFDHFRDVRSQVYAGVAAETPSTNRAVNATRGRVVTYQGKPIQAFFMSTSGGRTETNGNAFGGSPLPYLQSVPDPTDRVSPYHRWTIRLTRGVLAARLGGWVKGSLVGIRVLQRGTSPRILRAEVVGSRGRTTVTGLQLKARLRTLDSWMSFTSIETGAAPTRAPAGSSRDPGSGSGSGSTEGVVAEGGGAGPAGDGTSGGVAAAGARAYLSREARGAAKRSRAASAGQPGERALAGRVFPASGRVKLRVQRRSASGSWRTVARARTARTGRYRVVVRRGAGVYRVIARGARGPATALR